MIKRGMTLVATLSQMRHSEQLPVRATGTSVVAGLAPLDGVGQPVPGLAVEAVLMAAPRSEHGCLCDESLVAGLTQAESHPCYLKKEETSGMACIELSTAQQAELMQIVTESVIAKPAISNAQPSYSQRVSKPEVLAG